MRCCVFVLAALTATGHAQRQTGAPAGIPVPVGPAVAATAPGDSEAPHALHFRVRVVDGRNGTAISNAHVRLWYDEPAGDGYLLTTDPQGYGNMPAPVGEPVRVLGTVIDYSDCRRPLRDDPPVAYNLHTIAVTGTAAQNGCGRVAARTAPGELILFVRPGRWYEGINRGAGN